MYKYQVVIRFSSMDNAYIASVPELQGCMADGETPELALKELSVVYDMWMEVAKKVGKEIPDPVLYAS